MDSFASSLALTCVFGAVGVFCTAYSFRQTQALAREIREHDAKSLVELSPREKTITAHDFSFQTLQDLTLSPNAQLRATGLDLLADKFTSTPQLMEKLLGEIRGDRAVVDVETRLKAVTALQFLVAHSWSSLAFHPAVVTGLVDALLELELPATPVGSVGSVGRRKVPSEPLAQRELRRRCLLLLLIAIDTAPLLDEVAVLYGMKDPRPWAMQPKLSLHSLENDGFLESCIRSFGDPEHQAADSSESDQKRNPVIHLICSYGFMEFLVQYARRFGMRAAPEHYDWVFLQLLSRIVADPYVSSDFQFFDQNEYEYIQQVLAGTLELAQEDIPSSDTRESLLSYYRRRLRQLQQMKDMLDAMPPVLRIPMVPGTLKPDLDREIYAGYFRIVEEKSLFRGQPVKYRISDTKQLTLWDFCCHPDGSQATFNDVTAGTRLPVAASLKGKNLAKMGKDDLKAYLAERAIAFADELRQFNQRIARFFPKSSESEIKKNVRGIRMEDHVRRLNRVAVKDIVPGSDLDVYPFKRIKRKAKLVSSNDDYLDIVTGEGRDNDVDQTGLRGYSLFDNGTRFYRHEKHEPSMLRSELRETEERM